jgi:hypothetical protein
MRARKDHSSKKTAKGERIGRQAFAAISAVEGIRLTSEMKQRAAEFDHKGRSGEERRRAIIRAHRKG